MVIASYVWTMTYEIHNDLIRILDFNKEDPDGYIQGSLLGNLQSISEDENRVAQSVTIDNVIYEVENKQGIFTYKQPIS
jgi:hypothetical protein